MQTVHIFSLSLLVLACGSSGPIPETPEMRGGCASAAKRMHQLSCDGAQGSPGPDLEYGTADDVSFVEACIDIETTGLMMLNTRCIANATSCREVDACAEGPAK